MQYLLVNHVPFRHGDEPGHYEAGDLWLEDLRAQVRAIHAVGGRVIVATPCRARTESVADGGFHATAIDPAEEGFEYVPLPPYTSWREFLRVRRELTRALRGAIANCTIVQADHGGYPLPLGRIAWPIAARLSKPRIWAFDGGDPIGQWLVWAKEEPNLGKRLLKTALAREMVGFFRSAVRDADLVFAHNAGVVEYCQPVWHERCHQFERTFVTEGMLLSNSELDWRRALLLDATSPLRLVVAGRQIAIKATDQVLRAMARAREQGAALTLDVLGEGDELERYKRTAVDLGLTGVVRFRGALPYGPELFRAISEAHVMVITNLVPELSRNFLLAMALGLPLVAYRNPGSDALVEKSGAGALVPAGDVTALADTLVQLCANRLPLTRMAENGLAYARSNTLDRCHRHRAELALEANDRWNERRA